MMYKYIMDRTQIYLTKRESAALDRAARETGMTRSHLIREAIEAHYLPSLEPAEVLEALTATAGLWAGRVEHGEAYVERMRPGRLARIHRTAALDDRPEQEGRGDQPAP